MFLMKVIKSLRLPEGLLESGLPDSQKELNLMFELRTTVYRNKGYINKNADDKDEFDEQDNCFYFITFFKNKLCGTARVIKSFPYPLPTEYQYARYEEPEGLKNIPREKRGEVTRLITINPGEKLPIFLITLITLSAIIDYCLFGQGIEGGIATIKRSLFNKFHSLNIPVLNVIENVKIIYKGDLLRGYFNNYEDPPVIVWFNGWEAKKVIDSIINRL